MAIINSIAHIQQTVDVRIQANYSQLSPRIPEVLSEIVFPLISTTIYNHYDAMDELTASPADKERIKLLRAAVANFVVGKYVPFGEVSVSATGITRIEGDNDKTAFKYQSAAYQRACYSAGWVALEHFLDIIDETIPAHDAWKQDNYFSRYIRSGRELNDIVRLIHPNLSYVKLMPIFKEVRDILLYPAYGHTLEEIEGNMRNDESVDPIFLQAYYLLKRIMANAAMVRGIMKNIIIIEENGLTTVSSDLSYSDAGKPDNDIRKAELLAESFKSSYEEYTKQFVQFLNANTAYFISWAVPTNQSFKDFNQGLSGLGML